jgi:hypothetical protein
MRHVSCKIEVTDRGARLLTVWARLAPSRRVRGNMGINPWWSAFGQAVTLGNDLSSVPARELASAIAAGAIPAITFRGLRECGDRTHAVGLEIEVEPPRTSRVPHSRN